MALVRAVDVSGWSGDIAPSAWQSMRSSGIELAIIQGWGGTPAGTGPNPSAVQQATGAAAAGILVAGYVWPPSSWPAAWPTIGLGAALSFLALDVEAGAAVREPDVAGVKSAGIRAVIYTAKYAWDEIMGGIAHFGDVPLWDAGGSQYGGGSRWPVSLQEEWTPYGGWTSRVGWQWQGTSDLFGASVDLSVFDRDFIFGPKQEEAMAVQLQVIKAPDKPSFYLVAGGVLIGIPSPAIFLAQGFDPAAVRTVPLSDVLWSLPRWEPGILA